LALLGGLGLLLEWLLFGRAEGRMRRLAARPANLLGISIRKAS
jgi:hypothetical protein